MKKNQIIKWIKTSFLLNFSAKTLQLWYYNNVRGIGPLAVGRRDKMLKHGTKVRHKLTSAMGDGVVVGDSRFGSVDVCWHFDKTRIIKMKDGRQFTNWRRSERVQDLMVRN